MNNVGCLLPCVYWKTKKTEIEKLLKWANSSARMCGRDGHAPDMTGCTAQALLACSHNFDMTPTLHASSQLTAYQGYCAGFPSEQCGPAGTLDFCSKPSNFITCHGSTTVSRI